jgi:hypothetical protein
MPLSASTTALDLCVARRPETRITEYYRTVQADSWLVQDEIRSDSIFILKMSMVWLLR